MRYPLLHSYLSRLPTDSAGDARLRIDSDGRIQGRFLDASLTSVFRPVRDLDGAVRAFDAGVHLSSDTGQGLSTWERLNDTASDEQSVELDRLCRVIHVLNFFRQVDDELSVLLIDVHERLLANVSSNHGAVFRRILDGLQLPVGRILLQLPQAGADRQWMISFVIDNYRRNGFRIATRAASADEAARQITQLRPDLVRIDRDACGDTASLAGLIAQADAAGVTLLFPAVDTEDARQRVADALQGNGPVVRAQVWMTGSQVGEPHASLTPGAVA